MNPVDPSKICFGLSEELDKASFAMFLQLAGRKELAETLAERCSSCEIIHFVDQFMAMMKTHINEQEYHRLFLGEGASSHRSRE
jgi:hypothetical protein